jgi:hypothetical protein
MSKTAYLASPFELVSVAVPKTASAKPAPQPTNHLVVIDCSGSMYHDLPLIRTQLKDKLPRLIAEGDTISLIWFSGKGEFGTLVKGEPVATLKDLSDLNKAIDRWLKPVGLTGFKEPLEEVKRLASSIGGVCSLFFMSDGCDNVWSQAQILKAVEEVVPVVASATFVEYGYYCNHPLMVSMAEAAGGALILNEDFKKYEPSFEAAMQKRPLGAKRIDVDLQADAIKGFAFAFDGEALLTFKVEGGKVTVPEQVDKIWYVAPGQKGPGKPTGINFAQPTANDQSVIAAAYAAVALYSQRMATDVVLGLLKNIGDVRVIKQFSGCFGKQKYAEFVETTTLAALNPKLRWTEGYDPKSLPDDNAFTVLDLLRIISEDDDNRLLLDSEVFRYNRIGRPRVQEAELTAEEQQEVEQIQREMKVAKGKLLEGLETKLASVQAGKSPLKFTATPDPNGVPVGALIYNETRPNVSVQTRREGTVDLKERKGTWHPKIPDVFPTFVYRNYTIIRDGLVNVETLPLKLTAATLDKLKKAGIPANAIGTSDTGGTTVINLRELPIINRAMVQATSAKRLFELEYELTVARAGQKVYNAYYKENFEGRASEGFKVLYGVDGAEWLKEQGITDYSGFSPKGKQAMAQDVYMGKELHVALKGLSSLPTLKDVQARIASGKHTASSTLMAPFVKEVEDFLASSVYEKASDQAKVYKAWLEGQAAAAKTKVRGLLYQLSQIRMSVIVGQTWFTEFSSLDDTSLTIQGPDGKDIVGTVTMKEIEVPI